MVVADCLYLLFAFWQKRRQGQFPSKRFDGFWYRANVMFHVLTGSVVIYLGIYFHIGNELQEVYEHDDTHDASRRILYFVFAGAALLHSATVFAMVRNVMGEKRITIPLYASAAIVNVVNAGRLLMEPTLAHAFWLWGSMNVFIFVRAQIAALYFASIDWELLYTYGILAAAFVTYPLTMQIEWIYLMLLSPVCYAPFHERICHKLCFQQPGLDQTILSISYMLSLDSASFQLRMA